MIRASASLLFGLLAGCQRTNEVSLQFGPDPTTVTQGFRCRQDGSTQLMLERADADLDNTYELQLVIDIIELGGSLPGCRGEELLAACGGGACSIAPASRRYCETISYTKAEFGDAALLLATLREQLAARPPVTGDAPNGPVVIRAVATTEPCDALTDRFVTSQLVGCAYSCPVQLDGIEGSVSLSLDTLDASCEREVQLCAAFPR